MLDLVNSRAEWHSIGVKRAPQAGLIALLGFLANIITGPLSEPPEGGLDLVISRLDSI